MKWFGLALLVVLIIVGIQVARCGLCPNHGHGEIRGQLRAFGPKGPRWEGRLIVDAGAMKRRFGDWSKNFDLAVSDPEVAKQVEQANNESGTIEVEYRQWLIKPLGHASDLTVVAAVPVR